MIWLIVVGTAIAVVIGVSIWFYSGDGDCEPISVEKEEYEPDYPVKELLELVIREGYCYVKDQEDDIFKFDLRDAEHWILRRYINPFVGMCYISSIDWLSAEETIWLYKQILKHSNEQKEIERKKQREEAGEWIKQELGATDKAKNVLQSILQWNCYFDMSQVKLTENELAWIGGQLEKGTSPK